jgi:sialic acid synthase SpsE
LDDSSGPDAAISLTMNQMRDLVSNARLIEKMAL